MPDANGSRLSAQELAELARAGMAVSRYRSTEVAFEVHHLADRPGYFFRLHGWPPDGPPKPGKLSKPFFETLSSAAYGVGVVVRTAVRPVDVKRSVADRPTSPKKKDDGTWVFRQSAQPNPSFLYESTSTVEGLISIVEQPDTLLAVHGQAVREVIQQIAKTASKRGHPILSLQSPVQMPPRRLTLPASDPPQDDWISSSALGVRFSIAVGDASAQERWHVAKPLADFCAGRGLGMWVTDWRPGRRSGNWFPIVRRRKRQVQRYLSDLAGIGPHRPVTLACPITLVGPARVGTTNAVMNIVKRFRPDSVIAVSVTSLDDLVFINLVLALPGRASIDEVRGDLGRATATMPAGYSCYDQLKTVLEAMGFEMVTQLPEAEDEDQQERIVDYQVFAGPPVVPRSGPSRTGRPLWIAWQVDRSEHGMAVPLRELAEALEGMGLIERRGGVAETEQAEIDEVTGHNVNIEYLVCRDLPSGRVRGKGKLSVPDRLWRQGPLAERLQVASGHAPVEAGRRLASQLEERWHQRLAPGPGSSSELSVGWREPWLSHWSTRY